MDPKFWLETWEAERIGFHLDGVNPLLERYWPRLCPEPDGTVFVPLCGKSLDLAYLRRLGHSVVGVELSPLAISQFFGEQGLSPVVFEDLGLAVTEAEGVRLIQGDFFELRSEHLPPLAAVYDRAALIAMPPERQAAYAGQLMALIPAAAPMLLITLDYDSEHMQGPPFATPPAQVERLFGERFLIEVLASAPALTDNPGLAARGLTRLTETAFALRPK